MFLKDAVFILWRKVRNNLWKSLDVRKNFIYVEDET